MSRFFILPTLVSGILVAVFIAIISPVPAHAFSVLDDAYYHTAASGYGGSNYYGNTCTNTNTTQTWTTILQANTNQKYGEAGTDYASLMRAINGGGSWAVGTNQPGTGNATSYYQNTYVVWVEGAGNADLKFIQSGAYHYTELRAKNGATLHSVLIDPRNVAGALGQPCGTPYTSWGSYGSNGGYILSDNRREPFNGNDALIKNLFVTNANIVYPLDYSGTPITQTLLPPRTTVQTPVYVKVSPTGNASFGIDEARLKTLAPNFTGFDSNNLDTTHIVITNSAGKTLSLSANFDPLTQFYVKGNYTTANDTAYDLNTTHIKNYDVTLAPDDFGIDLLGTTIVLPQGNYTLYAQAASPNSIYNFTTTELFFAVNGKNVNLEWIGDSWCYSGNGQDCSLTPPTNTATTLYDGNVVMETPVVCAPWDMTCVIGEMFNKLGQFYTWLFVPDFAFLGAGIANMHETFQRKLGFIYYPFTFLGTFLNGITVEANAPSCTANFGTVYGYPVGYNFCSFQTNLPTFFAWAQAALIGLTSFTLMFALNTKLQGVLRQ